MTDTYPELHPAVRVMDGVDVDAMWAQFHFFEALHHQMDIMNPLASEDLDTVIAAAGPADGDRVLDIGCGHGESLLRMAQRAHVDGLGIDLSPWQINRAARRAEEADLRGDLAWRLGSGAETPADPQWDIVVLLGVSWIWGGFVGTLDSLIERAAPGGTIVFGDVQLRREARRATAEEAYGPLLTRDQQLAALAGRGIEVVAEVPTMVDDWNAYEERSTAGADAYVELHPGEQSEGFRRQHWEWAVGHRDDHELVGWTVWVGRVPG